MKKILSLLFLFLLISISYSQDSTRNSSQKKLLDKYLYLKIANDSVSNIQISESISHSGEIKLKSDNQSIFEFIFPSLIAIFIGGLAFFATLISSKRQLRSNKEALEKQTDSSLEIAKLDFRKSVLSANRQSWINELRELMSELISLLDLNLIDPSNVKLEDSKKINLLILKAEFMLNPIKDSAYINSIINLKNLLFDLSMEKINTENSQGKIEIVKQNTKKTLKTEWERVKGGE